MKTASLILALLLPASLSAQQSSQELPPVSPSAPKWSTGSGFRVEAGTVPGEIRLRWSIPDQNPTGDAIQYAIWQSPWETPVSTTWPPAYQLAAGVTEFLVRGLDPKNLYRFSLRAGSITPNSKAPLPDTNLSAAEQTHMTGLVLNPPEGRSFIVPGDLLTIKGLLPTGLGISNLRNLVLVGFDVAGAEVGAIPVTTLAFSPTAVLTAEYGLANLDPRIRAIAARVTVVNSFGQSTLYNSLRIPVRSAIPAITITSPASSPFDTSKAVITLQGNADDDVGVTQVSWSNGSAQGTAVLSSPGSRIVSWTAANIPLQGGTNNLTVTVSDGSQTSAASIVVRASLGVTSVVPAFGGQGALNRAVTIEGTNFRTGTLVSFSGTRIATTSTTFVSATRLTATVTIDPLATVGVRDVIVTTPDGLSTTLPRAFTIQQAPGVTTLAPSGLLPGSSNQTVVMSGARFDAGCQVSFSSPDITIHSVAFNSASQMTLRLSVAAGAPSGYRALTVLRPSDGARVIKTSEFKVLPVPTITSVTPSSTLPGVNSLLVTIKGTNFAGTTGYPYDGTISLGEGISILSKTRTSSTTLTMTIGVASDATAGLRDLIITNPDGGRGVRSGAFAVLGSRLDLPTGQTAVKEGDAVSFTAAIPPGSSVLRAMLRVTLSDGRVVDLPITVTISGGMVSWRSAFSLLDPSLRVLARSIQIVLSLRDASGALSEMKTPPVSYDNSPPAWTTTAFVRVVDNLTERREIFFTNQTGVNVAWSPCIDTESGLLRYDVVLKKLDGSVVQTVLAAANATSATLTAPLQEGIPYLVSVTALNRALGATSRSSAQVVYDATPPVVRIVPLFQNPLASQRATFSLLCSETGCTFESQVTQLDGNEWRPIGSLATGVVYENLLAGDHTLIARARDRAGNVSSPTTTGGSIYTWRVDLSLTGFGWQELSISPLSPRRGHTSVWLGTSLALWGGVISEGAVEGLTQTGALYHPGTNAWTPLPTTGAPSPRSGHSAVALQGKMVVYGGFGPDGIPLSNGAIFDPATNTWAPLVGPVARAGHAAVAMGDSMILWGGLSRREGGAPLAGGERYSLPSAGNVGGWRGLPTANAPEARSGFGAALLPRLWTGTGWIPERWYLWGGRSASGALLADGRRYDAVGNVWESIPGYFPDKPRAFHAAVSVGWISGSLSRPFQQRLLIYGGRDSGGVRNDGFLYDPASGTWSPMSTLGAPPAREEAGIAFAGRHLLIWGGRSGATPVAAGAAYDVSTNTWATPSSFASSPASLSGRSGHAMSWNADRLVIWGGRAAAGLAGNGAQFRLAPPPPPPSGGGGGTVKPGTLSSQ